MDGIGSRESIQSIGSNATHDPTDDSTPFHLIPPPLVLVIRAITLISFVPGISNIYIYRFPGSSSHGERRECRKYQTLRLGNE